MERRFNLKAVFLNGKLDRLIIGDFGPVEEGEYPRNDGPLNEDSLIAWNVDPEFTGAHGIASILGCPVTDRFWNRRDFDRA